MVPPVDPNNQDTSVLIGSVDISKIDIYPEDDPRVLSLNGAFNVGKRGIIEFIEVFKNLRKILENETTINHNKYSNEDLYNKIVYPIMKYILYPEHLEIHTIHQN